MKQKWLWIAALLAAVAAVAGIWFWNTDDMKDRRVWQGFATELTEANVSKMEFGTGKPVTFSETERREVLALLREAEFDRSNRAGEGPTPQAVMSITFKDGKQVNIGMWGMTSYELSPRHLDSESQFLIKSEQLGAWLKKRFTGPAIGAGGHKAPGVV